MKKILPFLLLAICLGLGVILFTKMSKKPNTKYTISQSTPHAIINVADDETAQKIIEALINDKSRDPKSKTLIRIQTGNPTRLQGTLKGNGSIHVINPNGIIVGADTIIDLNEGPFTSSFGELNTTPPITNTPVNSDSVELKSNGKVYALSINKEDSIKSTLDTGGATTKLSGSTFPLRANGTEATK